MALAKRWNQDGKVIVLSETCDTPITFMGEMSGVCYNSDITDHEKNHKRGLDCLTSQHMRVAEYPQIYMILNGWSAKVIRELYTHQIGITKLQSSTRYINYSDFDYVTPPSVEENKVAKEIYDNAMKSAAAAMRNLMTIGIPKEDFTGLLPLNYETKVVVRMGLREFINICEQRLCARAYHEMRDLVNEMINSLSVYSDEWKELVNLKVFAPKCERLGYCPEKNSCGRVANK